VPDVISLQTFDAVDARNAILVAVGTGKLDDGKLHVDLMSQSFGALFFVIIIHHQCGVNNSRDPAEQRQKDAEEKTSDPSSHQHGQWWEDHAEKIPQRFHFCFFLICEVLCAPLAFTNS